MSAPHQRRLVATARSLLFVPGNRPDRFAKAAASGADLTILDLEDAVAPAEKVAARTTAAAWARSHDRCVVRVNGLSTPWALADLEALRGSGVTVMVPKAEDAAGLHRVVELTGGSPVIALIETPRGVRDVHSLADSGAVARLALGNVDLAACLGVDPASREAMAPARGALVLASAAAALPSPVDGVTTQLDVQHQLEDDVRRAREVGFGGRLCIHPRQVPGTNAGMTPTAEEVAWARRVLATDGSGVAVLDGDMLDAPVYARARVLLERAELDFHAAG